MKAKPGPKALGARAAKAAPKAQRKPRTKARARASAPAKKDNTALVDILGAAGWAEADAALAQSLGDFAALQAAADDLAARARGLESDLEQLSGRVLLARQSLEHLARRRGVARFGEIGEIVAYDPLRHERAEPKGRAPANVRICAPGVLRGAGAGASILVKALVEAAPVKSRASGRRPR